MSSRKKSVAGRARSVCKNCESRLRFETLEDRRVLAGEFDDVTAGLTGVFDSSVAWGDYDSDGDLDILLTGQDTGGSLVSRVYANTSGTFSDITAGLTGVTRSSAAWGDYDSDGDLDILLTGFSAGGRISRVYKNTAGTFSDISAGLTGVDSGSVAWGDYDNDGDLDILLTGYSGFSRIARVYANTSGTFSDVTAAITGVDHSSVAWGDYDNDGDLDILLTGNVSITTRLSRVYENTSGTFSDITAGLTGVDQSSVAWGDYDNDGDLDVLLTGSDSATTRISRLYKNTSGTFSDISAGLTDVEQGSVAWGDYDNDGDLDILLTGSTTSGTSPISQVYRNTSGTFSDISAGLTDVYRSSVAWGDYDGDGSLDILLTGRDSGLTAISKVYENTGMTANTVPGAPFGLMATVNSATSVTLTWTAPSDGETATAGLSYNLRVGTTPGGSDVVEPMSLTSGLRKIAQRGLVQPTTWTLDGLAGGQIYYWSVQAIDTALAGGPFGVEGSFTQPIFSDVSAGVTGVDQSSVAWGDYDDDGDLDVLITGDSGSGLIARVYRNTGGTFSDITAGLTGVYRSSVAWGDYDNDGDLDILLTGRLGFGSYISRVYRNTGGTFSDISAGLTGVSDSAAAWGDFDNDGDLDILLTGDSGSGFISRVYENTSGTFSDISAGLSGVHRGSVAWGDYDSDGDLDILLAGSSSTVRISHVYQNTSGTFSDIGAGLTGVNYSSVAWGDYDNDGKLDILLSGEVSIGSSVSKVYRNTGGTFSDISAGLTDMDRSSVAWGDYDNDGDLDILLTGSASGTPMSQVFENTSGTFSEITSGLTDVLFSSVAWGDYDGDGDLDILLAGRGSGATKLSLVYENAGSALNTVPAAPGGLMAAVNSATSITFSWIAPADAQTPTAGLRYNLRVGTTVGGSDVVSPMALTSGVRKIAQAGLLETTSWTIEDLTPGQDYFWSVQAIDTALAGGPFATESIVSEPDKIGFHRGDRFYQDVNGNGAWDNFAGGDAFYRFGNPSDVPIVGDWDGDGNDDIGFHRGDKFYLDVNGNGKWDNVAGGDAVFRFGNSGDLPVIGDWDGDGTDNIGFHRGDRFYLDVNGNGTWDHFGGGDAYYRFGNAGDYPIAGDWNGNGTDSIGFHRGDRFYLDVNGNGVWNNFAGGDAYYRFGNVGDTPIIGDWGGDGTDNIGFHRGNRFYLDVNGNGAWNNFAGGDAYYTFGNVGDTPIAGNWNAPVPLLAAGGASQSAEAVVPLSTAAIGPTLAQAAALWTTTGLNASQQQSLSNVTIQVANLPGALLGQALGTRITLDQDGAGYGWFVDSTPADNQEFTDGPSRIAEPDGPAAGRMDLLTVVMHELGHVLGYDHDDDFDALIETLAIGTRRGL